MDEVQAKLAKLLDLAPDCISNRQRLRPVLMDMIPGQKMQINLLMNAYDEDIISCLKSSDTTLHALRMIKNLTDGYGLTQNSAAWAVVSWCYILGLTEVAEALSAMSFEDKKQDNSPTIKRTHIIGIGAYKAGFDFHAGDIVLKHLTKDVKSTGLRDMPITLGYTIDCYVNNSSSLKGAKKICSFLDSCHLEINDGDYLIIKCDTLNKGLIRIELVEYN